MAIHYTPWNQGYVENHHQFGRKWSSFRSHAIHATLILSGCVVVGCQSGWCDKEVLNQNISEQYSETQTSRPMYIGQISLHREPPLAWSVCHPLHEESGKTHHHLKPNAWPTRIFGQFALVWAGVEPRISRQEWSHPCTIYPDPTSLEDDPNRKNRSIYPFSEVRTGRLQVTHWWPCPNLRYPAWMVLEKNHSPGAQKLKTQPVCDWHSQNDQARGGWLGTNGFWG